MFLTDASAVDMVTVSGSRVLFSVLTHIFVLDHISDLTSSTFELYCPGLYRFKGDQSLSTSSPEWFLT